MSRAVEKACNKWKNLDWGDGQGLTKTSPSQYPYVKAGGMLGGGLIKSHLELVRGLDRKECAGPIKLDFFLCERAMKHIIDRW